jgi:hypothetical protein
VNRELRQRVIRDKFNGIAQEVVFQGNKWKQSHEQRIRGHLRLLAEHALSSLESVQLHQSLLTWKQMLAEQQQAMFDSANGNEFVAAHAGSDYEKCLAAESAQRAAIAQVSHQSVRRAMQRRFIDIGFNRSRLLTVMTEGNVLRSQGPIQWAYPDLQGVSHSSGRQQARLTVLGFAADGRPETVTMLRSLAEMRQRWSETEVAIYHVLPSDRGIRQGLLADLYDAGIVPLSDHGTADNFRLGTVGMPALVVLDQRSCVNTLAAWQADFPAASLVERLDRQLRDSAGGNQAPLTFRTSERDNSLQLLAGFGSRPRINQWNRVFWLGYVGEQPYYLR